MKASFSSIGLLSKNEVVRHIRREGKSYIRIYKEYRFLGLSYLKYQDELLIEGYNTISDAYEDFVMSGFNENNFGHSKWAEIIMKLPADYVNDDVQNYLKKLSMLDMLHASVGISGEAGELIDIIKKNVFHSKPHDKLKIIDEAGDLLWYYIVLLKLNDIKIQDVMMANIAKLKTRYPNGRDKNIFAERDKSKELKSQSDSLNS